MAQSTTKSQQGFSVIEILASVFVLGFVSTGLIGAIQYSLMATSEIGAKNRAGLYASEGLEAVRNIRDSSYASLADGTYGLAISGGRWVFSGSNDTANGLTRQITISTPATDTKQVISTVTWPKRLGNTGSLSITSYLVNPSPTPPVPTQANDLVVTTSGISVGGAGNRDVLGMTLSNIGTASIVIDKITVSPSTSRTLTQILIGGSTVWSGSSATPTTADITDVTLTAGQSNLPVNRFRFNASVIGFTQTWTFIMGDGSTKTVTWP